MDNFVCNKCFATSYRGKLPYHITQCGHVYCMACIQEAEKQCLQCKQIGTISIPVQEQFLPKVEHLFVPLNESLSSLGKVYAFQSSQMNIMAKRFHDIDKKYEKIKPRYYAVVQQLKMLTEKYYNQKRELEVLRKGNISAQLRKGAMSEGVSSNNSLPMDRVSEGRPRNSSRSQFLFDRSGRRSAITDSQTFNTGTDRTMTSGSHMSNCKPTMLGSSHLTSDQSSSIYTFRR